MHALLRVLLDAADGRFPEVDGGVTWLPAAGHLDAVVAFTGHAFVATDRLPTSNGPPPDGLGGAIAPAFLLELADGRTIGSHDVVLAAPAGGRRARGRAALPMTETDRYDDHPRVRHARTLRDEVRVYATDDVLLTIGRGLAGRWELGVERTASPDRPTGDIPSLLAGARDLLPPGEVLFAAVAPGNARALRSFLAAGYRPIGAEILIHPLDGGPGKT